MSPDINSLSIVTGTDTQNRGTASHGTGTISTITGVVSMSSPTSPRSPSLSSLHAAAAINAGLQHSPGSLRTGLERRRSSLATNLELNNPMIPGPGEMQQTSPATSPSRRRRSFALQPTQPFHRRQPSLGELHQELESEQEAQLNRLLQMIRLQQDELSTLRRQQEVARPLSTSEHAVAEEPEDSIPSSLNTTTSQTLPYSLPPPSSSRSSARHSMFAGNSGGTSPSLRPLSGSISLTTDSALLEITRDESAFYQAETQSLTRANQMLKVRIRELERQIDSMSGVPDIATRGRTASQISSMADTSSVDPANV